MRPGEGGRATPLAVRPLCLSVISWWENSGSLAYQDAVAGPARQCTVTSQQFLYFLPLPHGQGSFRAILAWCVRSGSSHSCSAPTVEIDRPMCAYCATALGTTR